MYKCVPMERNASISLAIVTSVEKLAAKVWWYVIFVFTSCELRCRIKSCVMTASVLAFSCSIKHIIVETWCHINGSGIYGITAHIRYHMRIENGGCVCYSETVRLLVFYRIPFLLLIYAIVSIRLKWNPRMKNHLVGQFLELKSRMVSHARARSILTIYLCTVHCTPAHEKNWLWFGI